MVTLAASPIRDVLDWIGGVGQWLYDGRTWLDLGAAGLGFDIVGAWLLALAVLLPPHEVFSRTHAQDTVFTPDDEEQELARDTLRAAFGIALLGVGFAGQLAALIASQAADSPQPTLHRALVATLCAVFAIAAGSWLSWLGIRLAYRPFLGQARSVRSYLYRRRMEALPRIGSLASIPPAPQEAQAAKIPRQVVSETVEALLENAKALADSEDARGASFKLRAGWLLGFLGVMLTILLTQARELPHAKLGALGTPVAGAFVVLALVFILGAAQLALKTLSVVKLWHVEPAEAEKYATYEYVSQQPEDARGKMLRGWVKQFAAERPANSAKAEELQRAFRRLLYGFFALAGLSLTVLARAFGL